MYGAPAWWELQPVGYVSYPLDDGEGTHPPRRELPGPLERKMTTAEKNLISLLEGDVLAMAVDVGSLVLACTLDGALCECCPLHSTCGRFFRCNIRLLAFQDMVYWQRHLLSVKELMCTLASQLGDCRIQC